MFDHVGPLEVECDAPCYAAVQASSAIGIQTPEDVRWCRVSHYLNRPVSWREVLSPLVWRALLGVGKPQRLARKQPLRHERPHCRESADGCKQSLLRTFSALEVERGLAHALPRWFRYRHR